MSLDGLASAVAGEPVVCDFIPAFIPPRLGCAPGCGACCDPVILGVSAAQIRTVLRQGWNGNKPVSDLDRESFEFILGNWTQHPESFTHGDDSKEWYRYDCAAFNSTERTCMARDDDVNVAPPICTMFPDYIHVGPQPVTDPALVHCSYNGNVAPDRRPEGSRPLIPLHIK